MPHHSKIKLDVTLEFLTPAVLGAAQPRRLDPHMELRPASLRGVWRYWFRALAASLMWPAKSDKDGRIMVTELSKVEASLFGDTTQRSVVSLLPPELTPPARATDPLTIPDQKKNPGLRYLGYGLFEDRSGRPPEHIALGTTAKLRCLLRSPGNDASTLRALCATLWAWATLGGLGGRARRGYGSVRLVALKADAHADAVQPWSALVAPRSSPDEYLASVREGIGRAQDAMTAFLRARRLGEAQLTSDGVGPHPAIRSVDGIAQVHSLRHSYATGLEALEHAGALFQDFRSTLRRRDRGQPPLADYFEVKSSLKAPFNPPRRVERAAFGLPLRFYYRSLGGASTTLMPLVPGSWRGGKRPDRLASPLIFRVFKMASGEHGVAFINLAGKETAPPLQGCGLVAQRGSKGSTPEPSNTLIHDFITWAVAQPPPSSATASAPRRRNRNR